MGFWFPASNIAFQGPHGDPEPSGSIFYYKVLTICTAILKACTHVLHCGQLAIFTNNLNTVQLFNSLMALPSMNWMVILAVDSLMTCNIYWQVFHISGVHNVVANCISHLKNCEAIQASLGLTIQPFQPPQSMLGAAQK
ncbi:hypothetical protein PAXRUDRAFT_172093 [Paxillus rubicundulus Ve08.2h10]|uniref:RNase H type-1 domain-containing protein n=1 Tax=Paxillus rubicundulus Ve08.2h10 TaxID=930991 RepID=A0A0D0CX17_9AGAM|nr:hypothetical protein PAXRUDRAFT_172093 [Paxillus rubicundulus Ve08.2h10]